MDPNELLKEMLSIAKRIQDASDRGSFAGVESAERLAECVQALDTWIKCGGFLPKQWRKNAEV